MRRDVKTTTFFYSFLKQPGVTRVVVCFNESPMNCTRVLHILSQNAMPSAIMPVDMAMRICLTSSPPLCSFLGNYDNCSSTATLLPRRKPLRPCLSSRTCSDTSSPPGGTTNNTTTTNSRGWQSPRHQKKRVVFADSQGMSLTAVHIFKEFEEDPLSELQFHLSDLEGATAGLTREQNPGTEEPVLGLVLAFPQPAADYLDLRNRLKTNQVCLENCSLQERSLSGTVKVRNVSFKKSVHIRVTFDSWRSFLDVPCSYLNNVYGCPDTDTFSFTVEFQEVLDLSEGVEFCVQYQGLDQTFWDNNDGNNYRLVPADTDANTGRNAEGMALLDFRRDGGGIEGGKEKEMEFDRFGSPRTSAGIFPEWQSWGRIENSAPYW